MSVEYNIHPTQFQGIETTSPEEAAGWITDGKIVATEFGNVIALFCKNQQDVMDHMALLKGLAGGKADARGEKPNTLTTALDYHSDLQVLPGLERGIPYETLEIIQRALEFGSEEHPFGLLLPADTEGVSEGTIPKRIVGAITPYSNQPPIPTVGIMVSGPDDASYSQMVRALDTDLRFVAGSSGNASGDPKSRGSGHHLWKPFKDQFTFQEICLLYPQGIRDILKTREGGSTSMVFVDRDGIATISREGSVKIDEIIDVMIKAGAKEIRINPNILRHAEPFDYSSLHKSNLRLMAEDFLVWAGVRFKLNKHILYPRSS